MFRLLHHCEGELRDTLLAVPKDYSFHRFVYEFVNIVIFRYCTHMFRLKYALNLKAITTECIISI